MASIPLSQPDVGPLEERYVLDVLRSSRLALGPRLETLERLMDQLMRKLQAQSIGCAPYFPPIHLQPYYRERFGFKPGDFPVCERIAARTLALPFFPALTQEEVHRVASALHETLPTLPRRTSAVPLTSQP